MLKVPRKLLRCLTVLDRPDTGWRTTEEGKHYRINKHGEVTAGPTAMVGENVNAHKSEYQKKLTTEREQLHSKDEADQALFVWRAGLVDQETAIEAMNNGTAHELVDQYFDIMEKNGDPTPTKPIRDQRDLAQEIREGKHNRDWEQARLDVIQEWSGQTGKEALSTLRQMQTWFGGSWSRADTETLDRYIDADGAAKGPIYRGMHFSEEQYQKFMQGVQRGATMRMNGYNSSWTTNKEDAWNFSRNGERHVVIHCLKNKTSAPVDPFSALGESEVLAHSRAQWTVLSAQEGVGRTEIFVVEAEERMSREDRDDRKQQRDSEPQKYKSLGKRMNEQSEFITFEPPKDN